MNSIGLLRYIPEPGYLCASRRCGSEEKNKVNSLVEYQAFACHENIMPCHIVPLLKLVVGQQKRKNGGYFFQLQPDLFFFLLTCFTPNPCWLSTNSLLVSGEVLVMLVTTHSNG